VRRGALKAACHIEEGGQARAVEPVSFPLSLGGRGADIAVPGLEAGEPAALLALDRGELFVQPRGTEPVSVGGTPVAVSRWLRDGDELRLLGTRIRVNEREGGLHLRVEHGVSAGSADSALPAGVAGPEAAGEGTLVQPVPFAPKDLQLARPRRALPRPPLAGVVAALALASGGAFVLAAQAVDVQVRPEPERIAVRGWPHLAVGGTRMMLPGRYRVFAERAGYRPLEASIEVTGERGQVVTLALEPLPGRLVLETTPADGVRVAVDGTERGRTPIGTLELPRGDHDVELRAEGYAPFHASVTLAGKGETHTLRAALVPDRAPVSFSSEPPGATVRVDGGEVGRTPLTVDLTSGSRRVEVSLAGHGSASRRIEVVPDRPLAVPPFRLALLPGRVAVTSDPSGAAVRVGGEFRGDTPVELELVARKEHAFQLTRAGHEAAEARVTLDPGESRALALTLTPLVGDVEVTGQPADAEVVVDGEPRGRLGQTLRLTAVPHEVEVRRSGYESHRVTLTPRPGFAQAVRVRLRAAADAGPAERPRVLRTAGGHELRLLPPGRFRMGASRREPGRRANETLREVELARPVYVGASEVTNGQFRRFRPGHASGRFGAHSLEDDARPVVNVTWEDAVSYCNWLSTQEGLAPAYVLRDGKTVGTRPLTGGYRLPTEAEWSRAARYPAEGPLKYAWGDELPVPPRAGNYADESAKSVVGLVLQGYDDGHAVSAPVGSFRPNALGFLDLGGNVAEWVHDAYTIPPADGPVDRDPAGPEAGELHVILGGSYLQGAVTALRLSYRDYGTKPRPDLGFRIARYSE